LEKRWKWFFVSFCSHPFISCHGLGPMICDDSEHKGSSNVIPPSVPENENPAKPSVDGINDK
jgi:hypothetical protein